MYLNIYLHLFFYPMTTSRTIIRTKPSAKPIVERLECVPLEALGDVALHKEHERCPEYCAKQRDEKTY